MSYLLLGLGAYILILAIGGAVMDLMAEWWAR